MSTPTASNPWIRAAQSIFGNALGIGLFLAYFAFQMGRLPQRVSSTGAVLVLALFGLCSIGGLAAAVAQLWSGVRSRSLAMTGLGIAGVGLMLWVVGSVIRIFVLMATAPAVPH